MKNNFYKEDPTIKTLERPYYMSFPIRQQNIKLSVLNRIGETNKKG